MTLSDRIGSAVSDAKRRLKQDALAGERAAREQKDAVKRRAKQDLRAANRAARRKTRETARGVKDSISLDAALPEDAGGSDDEGMAERAASAAEVSSPVDASLDPVTTPQDVQYQVSSGLGGGDDLQWFGSGGDADSDGGPADPLAVDDAFGLGVGGGGAEDAAEGDSPAWSFGFGGHDDGDDEDDDDDPLAVDDVFGGEW